MTKTSINKKVNNKMNDYEIIITSREINKLQLLLQKYINDPVKENAIMSEYKSIANA